MENSRKRHLDDAKPAGMIKRHISNRGAVTQPNRRHYPLINQGATCYLSSVLQVLFMTSEMHDRLDPTSCILDRELKTVFKNLPKTSCRTENITDALGIFNVHQQRDAAECLEMLVKRLGPKASQLFQGQLRETTTCLKGHVIIEETTPFLTLPLSLQDGHSAKCSVKTGFRQFFQSTAHTGDSLVFCRECKQKTEATSGCEMVDFPQVMTLLLKRFDFDFNTRSDVKSNCCVEVPFTIQTENKSYRLYGMVNHMGSLRGGHYTATVLSGEDSTWYDCDDTHVTEVEEQPFANNRKYSSSTAYLLMYRASASRTDKLSGEHDQPKNPRSPAKTQKKPILILLIVFGCVVLVILVILFSVFVL